MIKKNLFDTEQFVKETVHKTWNLHLPSLSGEYQCQLLSTRRRHSKIKGYF